MNISNSFFNVLTVKNPKTLYQINKSKKLYKKLHGECAVCGNKKYIECHHVIPVHVDLNLACEETNFIILCDAKNNGCHRWLGHFGNFRSKWNPKIREYAVASRLHLEKMQPNREFLVPTNVLIDEFSMALNITTEIFLEEVTLFNK